MISASVLFINIGKFVIVAAWHLERLMGDVWRVERKQRVCKVVCLNVVDHEVAEKCIFIQALVYAIRVDRTPCIHCRIAGFNGIVVSVCRAF
jgi:hypothetical protein